MFDRLRAANALTLGGPALLLGGALAFQYLDGLPPCEMCLWQRWPHAIAMALGLAAWLAARTRLYRPLLVLAGLAILASAALGLFHAGVEQHWWEGPTQCSAAPLTGSTEEIIQSVLATPVVRCDAIPWALFGLSLAAYNALFSGLIAGAVLWLTLRTRT